MSNHHLWLFCHSELNSVKMFSDGFRHMQKVVVKRWNQLIDSCRWSRVGPWFGCTVRTPKSSMAISRWGSDRKMWMILLVILFVIKVYVQLFYVFIKPICLLYEVDSKKYFGKYIKQYMFVKTCYIYIYMKLMCFWRYLIGYMMNTCFEKWIYMTCDTLPVDTSKLLESYPLSTFVSMSFLRFLDTLGVLPGGHWGCFCNFGAPVSEISKLSMFSLKSWLMLAARRDSRIVRAYAVRGGVSNLDLVEVIPEKIKKIEPDLNLRRSLGFVSTLSFLLVYLFSDLSEKKAQICPAGESYFKSGDAANAVGEP